MFKRKEDGEIHKTKIIGYIISSHPEEGMKLTESFVLNEKGTFQKIGQFYRKRNAERAIEYYFINRNPISGRGKAD